MSAGVVVTGAAGFLGGHVVQALLRRGLRATGVDRRPRPHHLPGSRLHWLRTELTEGGGGLQQVLRDADAVLHLAGCPGVRDRTPDVELRRQRDNVEATAAVLAATPRATPVVVTSSSSVYGGSRWRRPCRESDELRPRGGYAASKVQVEALCARRAEAGGQVLVARPFTVAGERQRADMALSLWIDAARAGRPLHLLGSPERTRDITDVLDAAHALVRLAETGGVGIVNVGTGQAHTLAQLADAVCAAVDRDVPRVLEPAASEEVRHTLASTARLEALVGFVPVTDLPRLVARQAAAQPAAALLEPELEAVP